MSCLSVDGPSSSAKGHYYVWAGTPFKHACIQPVFVEHLLGKWHFIKYSKKKKIVAQVLDGFPMEITVSRKEYR